MKSTTKGKRELYLGIAKEYIHCMADMEDRAPGTSYVSYSQSHEQNPNEPVVKFHSKGHYTGGPTVVWLIDWPGDRKVAGSNYHYYYYILTCFAKKVTKARSAAIHTKHESHTRVY